MDGVSSYVIDTEVVAYDRDTGNLLPFQVTGAAGFVYIAVVCRRCFNLLPQARGDGVAMILGSSVRQGIVTGLVFVCVRVFAV